ncbi:MAG: hypothetical protein WBA57_09860 [Elainellaceae cyanobacterium]
MSFQRHFAPQYVFWRQISSQMMLENIIIFAYVGFMFVGILHHEMWIDELQAWMIVRDSTSLIDLYGNLSYEGHPFTWYFLLYGLSQITPNPQIMQVFHLLISAGVVIIFTKFSPFSLFQKLCFAFGYFSLFEYGMISRNYSLGILLIFLFCTLYCQNRRSYLLYSFVLALLANINVFALVFSGVLSLLLLTDAWADLRSSRQQKSTLFGIITGAVLLVSSWFLSVLQMTRPVEAEQYVHSNVARAPGLKENIEYLATTLSSVWRSHVPIPMTGNTNFWNTNIVTSNEFLPSLSGISVGDLVAVILSFIFVAAMVFYFSRKLVIACVYLLGVTLILSINYLYDCELRHFGHLFILLLACFWILKSQLSSPRYQHQGYQAKVEQAKSIVSGSFLLSLLLSAHLIAGVYAASMDVLYPFSYSRAAATYIQTHGLADVPLIGEDRDTSSISGYLNRPIYYLIRGELGTFWKATTPAIQSEPERIALIEEALTQIEEDKAVLILTYPISLRALETATLESLADFGQPISISSEEFFLYLVQKENAKLVRNSTTALAFNRNGS